MDGLKTGSRSDSRKATKEEGEVQRGDQTLLDLMRHGNFLAANEKVNHERRKKAKIVNLDFYGIPEAVDCYKVSEIVDFTTLETKAQIGELIGCSVY